jgi:hypothetical protein
MKALNKTLLILVAIAGVILVLLFINFAFSVYQNVTIENITRLLITGVLLGAVIVFFIWKLVTAAKNKEVKESSHTIVESIRKVFKIVCAEGHFNELYNFEETKKIFGFIPSTKRALVIIEAKVLVGYDFDKCVWQTDEVNQRIKLVSFPQPQILSIESDYKYYNFDEHIFNMLGREDLTRIQANGKKQVEMAAMKSDLPKIAAEQMRTLLTEVMQSKNWQIEDTYKITEVDKKFITSTDSSV